MQILYKLTDMIDYELPIFAQCIQRTIKNTPLKTGLYISGCLYSTRLLKLS